MTSTIAPVATTKRLQSIDIIRGFALLGIITINYTVDDVDLSPMAGWTSLKDQVVYWFISFLTDDRIQTIFCFLFGLGFAIQMQRATDRGVSFAWLFIRRMMALYLIGATLYILSGEGYYVLPYYAMMGILLLFFRKIPLKFIPLLVFLLIIVQ
jgi:uncharacterized protein